MVFPNRWEMKRRYRVSRLTWTVACEAPDVDGYCLIVRDDHNGMTWKYPFYGYTLGQGGWYFLKHMVENLTDQALSWL